MRPIELILSRLDRVRGRGDKWHAACPVHQEKTASLYVTEKPDGKITIYCFGCGAKGPDVMATLGLTSADLFHPREDRRPDRGARNSPPPQRALRRHYDWDSDGLIWRTAIAWNMQTEYQGLRWRAAQDRIYERIGPRMKMRENLKDKAPAWVIAAQAARE